VSIIFTSAAQNIRLMCNVTRINLDAPVYKEQYVSFPLIATHDIYADFFIRPQGVGITCKGDDLLLFYFLQNLYQRNKLEFRFKRNGYVIPFEPCLSGEGQASIDNPLKFYLGTIASGNLKDRCDIRVERDITTYNERAEFLADLLFTQWIAPMMPYIEMYKLMRDNKLLRELNSNFDPNAPHKDDGGLECRVTQ
jgi:hypothetical protein